MKAVLWPILALFFAVCASAQSSSKTSPSSLWLRTDEQTHVHFSRWHELAQIDFETEDKAVCKMVVVSGAPDLKPVLTVRSKAAVASLRDRLLKEGGWFPATRGEATETFFRWRLASEIKLLPGKGEAKNHLKVVHITNQQPLDLGIVTNAKVVRDILSRIDHGE